MIIGIKYIYCMVVISAFKIINLWGQKGWGNQNPGRGINEFNLKITQYNISLCKINFKLKIYLYNTKPLFAFRKQRFLFF